MHVYNNWGFAELINGSNIGHDRINNDKKYLPSLFEDKLKIIETNIRRPIKLVNVIKICKLKTNKNVLKISPIPSKYVW